MMKIIVLVGIITMMAGVAQGEERFSATWSDKTTSFAVLAAYAWIDYDQSAGWVTPGGERYELNPLLSKHPTRQDMLTYGAVGMGLLYLASEILPEPWDRIIVDSALSSEQWNIEDNVRAKQGKRILEATPIVLTFRF